MAINNRENKINEIVSKIKKDIKSKRLRRGPSLYFYKRLLKLRDETKSIKRFIKKDYNMEILYATLAAWDMNTRGAVMKDYEPFKNDIKRISRKLSDLEKLLRQYCDDKKKIFVLLRNVYKNLHVMKSGNKLVSNAKLLHFLFPEYLLPMDGQNTLRYFYNNTDESVNKYIDIINLSFEIMTMKLKWQIYLDGEKDDWNTNKPKLIDNAIILLQKNKREKKKKA